MRKTAIMQPYFMPYIGYWQLIYSADRFVVYDNIEYTKKGWFNRNRILVAGKDHLFTLPIKKDSDYLPVNQRYLSDDSSKEIARTLRIIQMNYKKAPYFETAYPIIESCFLYEEKNLFEYIYHSIKVVCGYLDIDTEIVVSSAVDIDHTSLKGAQKVLAICKAVGTDRYINAIGGQDLYDKPTFAAEGIDLKFIKSKLPAYDQFKYPFIPGLSIIDALMFNDKAHITEMLQQYTLE